MFLHLFKLMWWNFPVSLFERRGISKFNGVLTTKVFPRSRLSKAKRNPNSVIKSLTSFCSCSDQLKNPLRSTLLNSFSSLSGGGFGLAGVFWMFRIRFTFNRCRIGTVHRGWFNSNLGSQHKGYHISCRDGSNSSFRPGGNRPASKVSKCNVDLAWLLVQIAVARNSDYCLGVISMGCISHNIDSFIMILDPGQSLHMYCLKWRDLKSLGSLNSSFYLI